MPEPYQYLTDTIRQIDSSDSTNFGIKTIVSDGPYTGPRPPGWEISEFLGKTSPGNRDAWFWLISNAASMGGSVLCFEDDLEICPGGVERMIEFKVPSDLAAVKFFTPKPVGIPATNGLHRAPAHVRKGALAFFLQAVKFSHDGLQALDLFRSNPAYNEHDEADKVIALACDLLNLSFASHKPDLVQHVGQISKATKSNKLAWWRKSADYQAELDVRALDRNLYL